MKTKLTFSLVPTDESLKNNKEVMAWLKKCERIIKKHPAVKKAMNNDFFANPTNIFYVEQYGISPNPNLLEDMKKFNKVLKDNLTRA